MSFIDRTDEAADEIREALGEVPEAMARQAEDGIVGTMERSDPSGEEYADPEVGFYEASAPGEPPAIRTGEYVGSFGTEGTITRGNRKVAAVTNDRMVGPSGHTPLWAVLHYGDFSQAPRPHVDTGAREAAREIRQAAGGRS